MPPVCPRTIGGTLLLGWGLEKKLTDGYLRGLSPPSSGRVEMRYLTCRGLVLRMTKANARTWSFRYRAPNGGRVSRATIGRYPEIGLSKARATADTLRATVAAGRNPTEEAAGSRRGEYAIL